MKKLFLLPLFFCFAHSIAQQPATTSNTEWLVTSSSIKFKIKNARFNVDGTFEGLTAKIIFDEAKSFGNSIEATIDAKTVNTESKSRDGHLKKAEYFDVDKYAKISLKATVIGKEKDGSYKGYFKLTIKDKTKDVSIPFTFLVKENKGTLKGSFSINRTEFGVGGSSMILSNTATILIEVNVIKK
jgi:polyisoprenoid-binding protein YceI